MKVDKNDVLIITLIVVLITGLVLIIRDVCNNRSNVSSNIENITTLNVDSIDTITFYGATNEVFVTMLNGDEHYCEVSVANDLKYTKLGINNTKFEVWENSDGESEIVISYE